MTEQVQEPQVPRWVDADTILAPATARTGTASTGKAIGDGALEVTADDPAFEQWAQWLVATGRPRPGGAA